MTDDDAIEQHREDRYRYQWWHHPTDQHDGLFRSIPPIPPEKKEPTNDDRDCDSPADVQP